MQLFLFILANVFASTFQGIVGFGHGLIATPLSLLFLDKNTVLTAIMVIGTFLNLFLTIKIKEPLNKKTFVPLFIGSLIGMPIGIVILKLLPINALKIFIGSLSIFFTFLLLFTKIRLHNIRFITPIVGFISGVLQTSTSLAGAPLVLFLSSSELSKHSMRKILVFFFFWICVFSLILFSVSNVLSMQGIIYGICATPFILIAGHLGNMLGNVIPHKWYKLLALVTVGATGLLAIASGIQGIHR